MIMNFVILTLFCMIFCHVIADYNLQGWLASAKTKEWWQKNSPDELYKYDYLMALFMHSFSWTFMIILPWVLFSFSFVCFDIKIYTFLFLWNLILHIFIDNAKANWKKINLVQDQIIHLLQIFITWLWLLIVVM